MTWFQSLAHKLDSSPRDGASHAAFARNPARAGLLAGGAIGALNALLCLLLLVTAAPEGASVTLYLMVLNVGFFVGAFVGGLMGLACQWRDLQRGHLWAMLLLAEGAFLAVLALGLILEIVRGQ